MTSEKPALLWLAPRDGGQRVRPGAHERPCWRHKSGVKRFHRLCCEDKPPPTTHSQASYDALNLKRLLFHLNASGDRNMLLC